MKEEEAKEIDIYATYVLPALGEMIGTGLFVLFANLASAPSAIRHLTYSLISGLSLFVIRGFFCNITRGHFNPAVSISQFLIRRLDVASVICFVFVQLFGAFLGAVVFRALVTDVVFLNYSYGIYVLFDGQNTIMRSQGFFLEIILYATICLSYLYSHGADENLRISSCWTIVSFFSISLIGQSGNLAQTSANALVYYIFTNDNTATAYLYLHATAALIAIALSSAIWWLLTPSRGGKVNKSPQSTQDLKIDFDALEKNQTPTEPLSQSAATRRRNQRQLY